MSRRGKGTIWRRRSASTASLGKELRETGTTYRHVAMGTGPAACQQPGVPSCSAAGPGAWESQAEMEQWHRIEPPSGEGAQGGDAAWGRWHGI